MDGPSLPPSPNSSELAIEGVGNKTGPLDYLEHPVPLLGGEISKQDSYVSMGGPWMGWGPRQPQQLGYGCNLINWQNL